MANLLVIESSTPRASLVLCREGNVVFEGCFESDRHHNALLFGPLEEAIEALGDAPLDEIIVGTGPGSYSGTRVGIAAGQGVGLVHDCPVVGLSSLMALGIEEGWVVGDARRGSAWWAKIGDGLPDPQLISAAQLPGVIQSPVHALEDLANLGLPEAIEIIPAFPTAARLVEAWLGLDDGIREMLRTCPPQPAYLRPPHITESKKGHPLRRSRS